MLKSKLTSLLTPLSNVEFSEFIRFSIFHEIKNEHSYQTKLLLYIQKHRSKSNNKYLDKELVYREIYNGKKFNESKFKDVLSKCVSLFYDFLAYKNFSSQTQTKNKHLLAELNNRNLQKDFDRISSNSKNAIDKLPIRDIHYYLNHFEFDGEIEQNFQKKNVHEQNSILQERMTHLDIFYLASKLKNYCKILNWKIILNVDYETLLIEEITSFLENESNPYNDIPVLSVYHNTIKMLTDTNQEEVHLAELKNKLIKHKDLFKIEDIKEIYTIASNLCIKKLNSGDEHFVKIQFDLYKQMLENNLLYENNRLSQWKYMNIVALGLRINEHSWVKHFIEEHINGLPEACKQNAYTYNLANYHFACKNYDKAQTLIHNVEYNEPAYQPVSRALQLKIYFETGETELLPYHIENFKKFIQRNKLMSDYNKKTYINLIKYTEKLFDLIHNIFPTLRKADQEKALSKLSEEINEVKKIQNLTWLNQKIKELLT